MARESEPEFPDRRHPYRLPPEEYRVVDTPTMFTLCARRGVELAQPAAVSALVNAMRRVGLRRATRVHAYCVMPDHLHVVCSLVDSGKDLSKWAWYVKRESARALRAPGMWQRSYWDRYVRDDESLVRAVEYLLANPVRRGLAEPWCEWPYSWCEWYPETRGPDPNQHDRAG